MAGQIPPDEDEIPQVYAVRQEQGQIRLSRRDFLVAAGALAGTAAAAGCRSDPAAQACKGAGAHRFPVINLALAAGAPLLASSDWLGPIKLWSLPGRELVASVEARHGGQPFRKLAISPDGKLAASGDEDGKIFVYPLSGDIKQMYDIAGHNAEISALAFSPAGDLLASAASAAYHRSVKVWAPLAQSEPVATLENFADNIHFLAFTPNGQELVTAGAGHGQVGWWSVPDGKLLRTAGSDVFGSCLSPDQKLVGSFQYDPAQVVLWSLPDGELAHTLVVKKGGGPGCLALGPQDSVAAYSAGKTIELWSLATGERLRILKGHADILYSLAIRADGKLLVSGDYGGVIRLWSLPEGELLGCALDLATSTTKAKGITYQQEVEGVMVTRTLPCGAPIPAGGVCTCNCVQGALAPCSCDSHSSGSSGGSYWYPN